MRIIRLEAENVKRLHAVEIEPDGNVVVIAGRNGQGKTSVLDSIWLALGGGSASKETARPMREGSKKAHVTLDLGDIVVTRTWTSDDKSTLKVSSGDGHAKYSSPQSMLDNLVGRLSFDPLAFSHQAAKDQLATLLSLVELPFDPIALDREYDSTFDDRTVVNRDKLALTARLDAMPELPDDTPLEEVSTSDLVAEFRAATALIAEHVRVRNDAVIARNEQTVAKTKVDTLEAQLAEAREAFAAAIEHADQLTDLAASLDDDPDVSEIETRLSNVETTNIAVRAARARADIVRELDAVTTTSDALTSKLDEIKTLRADGVAAAKMPIDGLAFDAEGVTYNGHPFKDCSSAEQLRVSVAMAMAMNPTIRVVRITDGSLLDDDNMQLIAEMAAEHDFQVWIERVDESGDVGVVIEDGSVVAAKES